MIKRNSLYWDDIMSCGLNPLELANRCCIDQEDVRRITLPDASFDLLVTSPPYATCYEYKEIHQLTQLCFDSFEILCASEQREVWIGSKGVSQRPGSEPSSSSLTGSAIADAALPELSLLAVDK